MLFAAIAGKGAACWLAAARTAAERPMVTSGAALRIGNLSSFAFFATSVQILFKPSVISAFRCVRRNTSTDAFRAGAPLPSEAVYRT
jgi:hypothetical protein